VRIEKGSGGMKINITHLNFSYFMLKTASSSNNNGVNALIQRVTLSFLSMTEDLPDTLVCWPLKRILKGQITLSGVKLPRKV